MKNLLFCTLVLFSVTSFLAAQLSEARQEALDDFNKADKLRSQADKQASEELTKRWEKSSADKKANALLLLKNSQKTWLVWRELEAEAWAEYESGGGNTRFECYQYKRELLSKDRTLSLNTLATGAESAANEDGFENNQKIMKSMVDRVLKQDYEMGEERNQKMAKLWTKAQKSWQEWADAEATIIAMQTSGGATRATKWWKSAMKDLMQKRMVELKAITP